MATASECQLLQPPVEEGVSSVFGLAPQQGGQGGQGLGVALGLLTVSLPPPQMELKALKDQLEAERQAWVASCAKKEVGAARAGCGPGSLGAGFWVSLVAALGFGRSSLAAPCCSLLELEQEEMGLGRSRRPERASSPGVSRLCPSESAETQTLRPQGRSARLGLSSRQW